MQIDIDWVREMVQMVSRHQVHQVLIKDDKGVLTIKQSTPKHPPTDKALIHKIQENNAPANDKKHIVCTLVGRVQLGQDVLHPLVSVGDNITKGQVVAFVQAFDTLTPVVADLAGKVEAICVQDHDKVEYGTVLLKLVSPKSRDY